MNGKIYSADNYHILDDIASDVTVLDTVLLSHVYSINDLENASVKSLSIINKYRR